MWGKHGFICTGKPRRRRDSLSCNTRPFPVVWSRTRGISDVCLHLMKELLQDVGTGEFCVLLRFSGFPKCSPTKRRLWSYGGRRWGGAKECQGGWGGGPPLMGSLAQGHPSCPQMGHLSGGADVPAGSWGWTGPWWDHKLPCRKGWASGGVPITGSLRPRFWAVMQGSPPGESGGQRAVGCTLGDAEISWRLFCAYPAQVLPAPAPSCRELVS